MAIINFYHLTTLPVGKALPKLLEKVISVGNVLVNCPNEEEVKNLDSQMWTYTMADMGLIQCLVSFAIVRKGGPTLNSKHLFSDVVIEFKIGFIPVLYINALEADGLGYKFTPFLTSLHYP